MILLIASGLAIAASSMVTRPARQPHRPRPAAIALGLALMFALSPATRFGYFAYPLMASTAGSRSAGSPRPAWMDEWYERAQL